MKTILILMAIFFAIMLGTLEIYRWYRKGYEEGFDDGLEGGYKVGYNDAVKEAMEKLK